MDILTTNQKMNVTRFAIQDSVEVLDAINDDELNSVIFNAKDEYGNPAMIEISTSELSMIIEHTNRYYRKQEIQQYFFNHKEYDAYAIIEDKELLWNIVNAYHEYKNNSDNGLTEDLMHWRDCMERAVNDYHTELSKYLIEKEDF